MLAPKSTARLKIDRLEVLSRLLQDAEKERLCDGGEILMCAYGKTMAISVPFRRRAEPLDGRWTRRPRGFTHGGVPHPVPHLPHLV
jgi:hypothetical protein